MTTATIIYTYPMYGHPSCTPNLHFAADGEQPVDDSSRNIHQEALQHILPDGFTLADSGDGQTLAYRDGQWPYDLTWNNKSKMPVLREAGRTDENGHQHTLKREED